MTSWLLASGVLFKKNLNLNILLTVTQNIIIFFKKSELRIRTKFLHIVSK